MCVGSRAIAVVVVPRKILRHKAAHAVRLELLAQRLKEVANCHAGPSTWHRMDPLMSYRGLQQLDLLSPVDRDAILLQLTDATPSIDGRVVWDAANALMPYGRRCEDAPDTAVRLGTCSTASSA